MTGLEKSCGPVGAKLAKADTVIAGVRLVMLVPNGRVTAMVPAVWSITPAVPERVKDKIFFAELGGVIVTVTVYDLVIPFSAVTV